LEDFMRGKDLLSIDDLSLKEIEKIFSVAIDLKKRTLTDQVNNPTLPGRTLAMIFEKPSLRTRVSFDVGIVQLGGHSIYLQPSDIQLGKRESVADIARTLSRMVQGIMARVFAHQTVADLAKYADVPVINGLSDLEHPCQALADLLTIYEHKNRLAGLKLAYIGDGCNTCNSLLLLSAKLGVHMTVGCPEGYEPDAGVLARSRRIAEGTGSIISIEHNPFNAVKGADAVYTDVWASMGQESELEERRPLFQPFQINSRLVSAAKDDSIVLHCLPAHRGEEITDEVIDGPQSVVFDEAENRLHAQKAVMAVLM
jgi:ornithine carbamoyltransferase